MSTLTGIHTIISEAFNNSVVDLFGGGSTASVIGFTNWGGNNQKWNLVPQTESDTYYIQSALTKTYVSVDTSNKLVGSTTPKLWKIVQYQAGYRISSDNKFWTLDDGKPRTQASLSYLPILKVES
ncbi:hypothetical protein AN958_09275 [Leucoagaricus sp. SymC.cos]|nr:hypothetical protein AN958_09275 [Leucoagaricus sp. SymC.cos]